MQKNKVDEKYVEACRILTPEFRVSYPHLSTPQAITEGQKKKYAVTMLIPKTIDMTPFKKAIMAAKVVKWGDKSNWPKELRSPVLDGDDPKYTDKKGYQGHYVIKASSSEDQKPQLFDENGVVIIDAAKIYAGCYARAYVLAFAYEYMGAGVTFILDGVQKTRDGEAFGGKRDLSKVFQPINSGESVDFENEGEESFL